jgi:hypothetical protein
VAGFVQVSEPGSQGEPEPAPLARPGPDTPPERRPLVERIGLAAIAAVLATMFGGVAVAAWAGGEPFLAVMGGIGSLMTAWVGGLTLFRG